MSWHGSCSTVSECRLYFLRPYRFLPRQFLSQLTTFSGPLGRAAPLEGTSDVQSLNFATNAGSKENRTNIKSEEVSYVINTVVVAPLCLGICHSSGHASGFAVGNFRRSYRSGF